MCSAPPRSRAALPRGQATRRAVQFLGTLAIGMGALFLAFRDVDWRLFLRQLAAVNAPTFALGLLLFFGLHVSRAIRWGRIVQALRPDLRFRSYFSNCSVGFFLINVLPFRLGEFVRPWLLWERDEVPFGSGMATVVVERVLDVLALGVLFLGVLAFADLPSEPVRVGGESRDVVPFVRTAILSALLPGLVGLVGLIALGERGVRLLRATLGKLSPRLGELAAGFLATFVQAVRALGTPRRAASVLLWSVAVWSVNVLSMVVMAHGFEFGSGMGFWEGATIVVCICAVLIVPGPPGFVGLFELATIVSLALFGVAETEGAAFAVLVHGSQFLLLGVLGVLFLAIDRISVRRLLRAIQDLRVAPAAGTPGA